MRVFLGNSPWSRPGKYGVRAGSRWPHLEDATSEYMPFPFFLAYAAAVLEQRGHEVLLVDGIAERLSDEVFDARLAAFAPELVLLEVSTPSLDVDERCWRRVRERLGPEVKLALAGLHWPLREPAWLDAHPEVDHVLVGEYELTLADLCGRLDRGEPLEGLPGLVHRLEGHASSSGVHPLVEDLDALPWPARHHLPMRDYHDEPGSIPRPSVQMWASRGCPYRCSFCAWPQIMYGGHRYRTRRVVDVVDEMEWLVRDWGFRSVYFDDDTFNLGKRRMLELCAELRERELGVPWACMARVDGMDDEVLEALAGAGLSAVKYGVESGDQGLVDRCGKRLDLSRVREVVRATHALGVRTHLTFMLGLPGETRETARRTIDLALELAPGSLQFTLATPLPGSALYRELEAEGKLRTLDYSQYLGFHRAVLRTDELSAEELEGILGEAERRWAERRAASVPRTFCAPSVVPGEERAPELATVIIPNYNGERVLQEALLAALAQSWRPLQVIVVDDASTDGSAALAEALPEVEVIRRPENRGFAATVNAGLRAARGRYVALLNSDTRAEPGWLETSIRALERHPDAGVVAAKVLTFDHPPRIWAVGIGVTRGGYVFNVGQGAPERGQFDAGRYVPGASGAASVWRREVFEIVGGFDEVLAHYLEDADLSLRAQLEGVRCWYEPGAVVQHHGGAAIGGQGAPLQVRQVARNTALLLLKDVPRSILRRHPLRIGGSLLGMLAHHAALGRGRASLQGLLQGALLAEQMIAKRKRVLGHQKVPDQRVLDLMRESEALLRETAAQLPALSRARLRLQGLT